MKFGKDIKGVILDVDGVLLDSMGIWKDLGAVFLAENAVEPEEGLGEILFSMSLEQGAQYLKEKYLPDKTGPEILEDLKSMIRKSYFFEIPAKEGAAELLAALKKAGVRMAAATLSPEEHITAALGRNGLLEFIDKIFTASGAGSDKHSPEIYDLAAGFLGFSKEETCVIEDSLYALRTAAAAGYHTVGVFDWNGETDQKGLEQSAEIYIRSLKELMQLF